MAFLTDRCPVACMANVRAQDELEVLAVSYFCVECTLTEVIELLQLSSTDGAVGDIYL